MGYSTYLKLGKNLFGKIASNRRNYRQYCNIVKDWSRRLNQTSCSKIQVDTVAKSVVRKNGFEKESLETLQTTEFIEAFHSFLGKKGYEVPKYLNFWENFLPRSSGLSGQNIKTSIIYNPRCINSLDFRIPIHETGHLERHIFPLSLKMGKDNYLFDFGMYLKKVPFLKKFFKEHTLCHLSKNEQIALRNDYARAYKEGYFKHNPFYKVSKERIATSRNPKETRRNLNRMARDFRKKPEDFYMPNSQLNREEFIADYFNLAAQGFEFSPVVTAKYLKYGGPKIGEVITAEELEQLEKLRRQISKKSLNDYGYSWQG